MILVNPSRLSLFCFLQAAIIALVILPSVAIQSGQGQWKSHTKTNEEQAQELSNDKRYPFEDLLKGKLGAVANAEKIFALTSDPDAKERLASILLSIGVKDRVYFDYLTDAARKALDNDMPWPTLYDEHGDINEKPDHPAFVEWFKKHGLGDPNDPSHADYRSANPVFLDWCIEHRVNPNSARYAAYYEIPNSWYYFAAAADPRNYDLLIQGLHSHNLMIAGWAAYGLARLQDPRAVDELITTGRKVPGEARHAISESLLYFPDPKAQAAADELAMDKELLEINRQGVKAKGIKRLFGW